MSGHGSEYPISDNCWQPLEKWMRVLYTFSVSRKITSISNNVKNVEKREK
jgi:hypothetical protein